MSYPTGETPWQYISTKKKLDQVEKAVEDLRSELVEIGEEILREIEAGKVPSSDLIKRFRSLV